MERFVKIVFGTAAVLSVFWVLALVGILVSGIVWLFVTF